MKPTTEPRTLRIKLDTKHCDLRPSEIDTMGESLGRLEAVTANFPFADLYVTVSYAERSREYHIKTSLKLPGRILFTGEHDTVALPAYDRCVRKLVRKVEDYKARMDTQDGAKSKHEQGTRQSIEPTDLPELGRLSDAAAAGDYGVFREEMSGFDASVRSRIGRWVQRFPEIDATFGEFLPLDDLVEEVMLDAFEGFDTRPEVLRLGDWLESLIAPALRSLLAHPEEELEAVSYARTLREMQEGHDIPLVTGPAAYDTPVSMTNNTDDPGNGVPPAEKSNNRGGFAAMKPR